MAAKRNGAHVTSENGNGAPALDGATERFAAMVSMMQMPAANGFLVSQRIALEATRFWARRMRAYADQMEQLASCSEPNQLVQAQAHFIERLQEDYATEGAALTRLLSEPKSDDEQHTEA